MVAVLNSYKQLQSPHKNSQVTGTLWDKHLLKFTGKHLNVFLIGVYYVTVQW